MPIKTQAHFRAYRLTQGFKLPNGLLDGTGWVQQFTFVRQRPAQEPPAFRHALPGLLLERLRVDSLPTLQMTIADDLVSCAPAQQIVYGQALRLALDVPQGNVNGSEGTADDAIVREKAAPGERLPKMLRPHRILPDHQWLQVVEGTDDGELAAREP